MTFRAFLRRFFRRTEGQDLIEYALLSTFVALAVYFGVTYLGNALTDTSSAVSSTSVLAQPCTVADAVAGVETAGTCGGGGGGGTGGGGTGGGGTGGGGTGGGGGGTGGRGN